MKIFGAAPRCEKKKGEDVKMAGRSGEKPRKPAEKKVKMDRRARGRALVIFYISAFLAVVIGVVLLCTFVFFRVGTVTVTGGEAYRQEDILSVCSIAEGDNLVLLETGAREEALEHRFPYIESVEIKKHIPSTVEIVITEAETAFSIERESGGYLYVSRTGKVLEIAESPAQGSAVVHGCTPVNEEPSGQVEFQEEVAGKLFGQISAQLQEHGLEGITEIDLRNQYDITMTYDDRIVFRFGNTNDMEYKTMFGIGMLAKMQEDGDLTEETQGEIDLTVAAEKNKAFFRETLEGGETSEGEGIAGRELASSSSEDSASAAADGENGAAADDGTDGE